MPAAQPKEGVNPESLIARTTDRKQRLRENEGYLAAVNRLIWKS